MDESERLQRYKRAEDDRDDRLFAERIAALLNHQHIDHYCMVDAYYYDFSVIPYEIQQKNNFYRDMYLLFGITTKGEVVTRWVERYDLDSDYEIVNGEVIKPEEKGGSTGITCMPIPPGIIQFFERSLLSTPCEGMRTMFGKNDKI